MGPDDRRDTAPWAGRPEAAACAAVAPVLARVGDKWSVLIVRALGGGPRRFNDLKRDIGGISQRMLSLTLRGLERDGLVTRTVFATVPPRVDYALTDLGRSLWEPVEALGAWAQRHHATIAAAQRRYDGADGVAGREPGGPRLPPGGALTATL